MSGENGNGATSTFSRLKLPCGCGERKEIMGAGEWQKDAMIGGAILLLLSLLLLRYWIGK